MFVRDSWAVENVCRFETQIAKYGIFAEKSLHFLKTDCKTKALKQA